jgi:hypothetical protein
MDKPDPYKKRSPRDVITAEDWNEMQSEARLEIRNHTHTGDENGTKLSGQAIEPDADVTVRNLSVEKGFILGFSPLFDKAQEIQDQEAVKVLKNKPPGTFLIGGPCAYPDKPDKTDRTEPQKEFSTFRIYWKTPDNKFRRFDIFNTKGMKTIKTLDESGQLVQE